MSDMINFTNEQGLEMFDCLSRTSSGRQIKPLDQCDHIVYDHRYLYDEYNLMIGDVYIMVPPEFIYVSSESFSQSIQTIRQENSQKQKSGYHKRTIQIDLVFNGMDEINGYKVQSPIHTDGFDSNGNEIHSGYHYIDGLRPLLAEFKCTPFLPITNELLNDAYGIWVVALQSIIISTIDGFQNALSAHITLQEVDMMPYIEMPNIMFQHTIDWDLFRYYTQSLLTENYVYRNLQSLPVNKDHRSFKISILKETVLQTIKTDKNGDKTASTVKDNKDGTSKEETVLKQVINPENYDCIIDSTQSDVHITSFQSSYANMLTSIQMSDACSPTLQYLGGLDTQFCIIFETTDVNVVGSIEQCQVMNDLMVRNNPKIRGSIGFVKLESDLVRFCGSLYCTIESVETNTVKGIPGLYQIKLLCVSYDIAQSRREELNGFLPFNGHVSNVNELGLTGNALKSALGDNINQCIKQDYKGLMTKIYQDCYAEQKLRDTIEVYPDLRLPTYKEVDEAINNINAFRRYYGLNELPYTSYPRQYTNVTFGNVTSFSASSLPNSWCNNGGKNKYTNGNYPGQTKNIYEGYVDPDFYVFYPNTYLSIYEEEQEESKESEASTGQATIGDYTSPVQHESYSKTTTKTYAAIYNDEDDEDSKMTKFISSLRSMRGHHYEYNAEGEVKDYVGEMFDPQGLITWGLKKAGVLPSNFQRLKISSDFDKMDIFKEASLKDIKRGDIIVNGTKTECCVCTGKDSTQNLSVIMVNQVQGVTEGQLYFTPGHVYRIIPLQKDAETQGTSQSNPYPSDDSQYPDENGEILQKEPTALETTEGYESDNPYGDDNADQRSYNQQSPNSSSNSNSNTINQDLGVWAPISESELNSCINKLAPSNSPFRGNASIFIKAAQESGLDPRYILAHAALESGWGTSSIARNKNNYFGIGAFDNSPYASAYSFNSGLAAGIVEGAKWISKNYYNGSYNQKSLNQMRNNNGVHQYATDPSWHTKIASIMDKMPKNISAQYLSPNASDNPSNSSGQFTNTEQIKLNEYNRRNRAEMADQLSEDTEPIKLEQDSISDITLPDIEDDGSDWSDGSVQITEYKTMTTDEFNSLALCIAAECEGETIACKMAMAQFLYDTSQRSYNGGGLTSITKGNYFSSDRTQVEEKDKNEAKTCVQRVFQSGMRWKKDYRITSFTSMSNSNFASQNRNDKYDFVGNECEHNFYGYQNSSNGVGYNIQGYGVSETSSNDVTISKTTSVGVKNANKSAFGQPIYIKASHFDTHSNSVGREWQKLNSDENRLYTSFVDDCQYSGKGRLVKAFPTFLFCILDDQAQWYDGKKLWTNYYTYKPVINIGYHAANDMPTETAQITVTNTYHNLDRSSAALINYSISDDKDYCSMNRWMYKNFGMVIGGLKITNRLIQMHSIIFNHTKVREGARCHLRMGYGSDPLSLAPIINGEISGLTLGDQIGITITSDGHELIQTITSDKSKDVNNGALGLFGLGATQEASNIIAGIMVKRESWVNHLFFAGNWFEGSKYNIEHFGLYINGGDINVYDGFAGGIDTGIYEQYDLLMNIYNASTDQGWVQDYIHWGYMYSSTILTRDGESNIVFNQYNMTPWDVFQLCAQTMPEFLIKAEMYQFDSRLYYGLPFDLKKYRYDVIDGTIYQECKANTQVHYIDSLTNIIENQVSVTSRNSFTNAKVIYTRGDTPKSTSVIHSDDTIDHSKQSTHIIDSCIVQDYLGWDAFYEFTGISKQGKNAARKLGISNLLYGWQQQYQGQLLCLGCPQVRPDDYLMVNDFYTNLNGLTMVREVIHSFSSSTGFTTSIVPGVIGFSPEQDSGSIEMIANLLQLYSMFTEYSQNRKLLKENCERYQKLITEIHSNMRKIKKTNAILQGFGIANTVTTIAKDVELSMLMYKTVRLVKNVGSIFKTIKFIGTTINSTKTILDGIKIGKSAVNVIKVVSAVNKLSKAGKGVEATVMAISTASAPETLGISFAVGLIITTLIDIALNSIISWYENRNAVVLLPLWWEGEPFISGVKDGEKILLIGSSNTASDENTGEDGYETDADEISVEDN